MSGGDSTRPSFRLTEQQVTYSQGHDSVKWVQRQEAGQGEYIHVEFAASAYQVCPCRLDCTRLTPADGNGGCFPN